MSKKGFTLVEILVTIALLSVVMIFMMNLLIRLKSNGITANYNKELMVTQAIVSNEIHKDIKENGGIASANCTTILSCIITFSNGVSRTIAISNDQKTLTYSGGYNDTILTNKILFDNKVYPDNISSPNVTSASGINFGAISSSTNGQGLYQNVKANIEGDNTIGKIKYFRGNITNNFVSFAGMLWRIISIDGDGSVKLITNDGPLIQKDFYSSHAQEQFVGYTFNDTTATSNDGAPSNAKTTLESWYTNNLNNYRGYIQDHSYCNDTTSEASVAPIYYGAYARLVNAKTPTFDCKTTNKKYGGNYTLKVGLITADEVAYAGGVWQTENNTYYLYDNNNSSFNHGMWTMTPSYFNGTYANVMVFSNSGLNITSYGQGYSATVNSYTLRPVINLKKNVRIVSGIGTQNSPYVVDTTIAYEDDVNIGTTLYKKTLKNLSFNSINLTSRITDNSDFFKLVISIKDNPKYNIDINSYNIPNQTIVTFDKNIGLLDTTSVSLSRTSQTVVYGSAYGNLATASRIGYRFDGWYTNATGGTKVIPSTIVGSNREHRLYAHWTPTGWKQIQLLALNTSNTQVQVINVDGSNSVEYRYNGANVNNYVLFNNEYWRIIGTVRTQEQIGGSYKWRLKLIKGDIVDSDKRKWDSSTNNWVTSDLQEYLNTTYYNSLQLVSKSYMTTPVVWYLGDIQQYFSSQTSYLEERKPRDIVYGYTPSHSVVGTINNTDYRVGLIYPSDYSFASANAACDYVGHPGCETNNWLRLSEASVNAKNEWTMTPAEDVQNSGTFQGAARHTTWMDTSDLSCQNNSYKCGLIYVNMYARVNIYDDNYRPVIYLNENVYLTSGTGIKSTAGAYKLGIIDAKPQ